jgi:hypothetical protein
MILQRSYRAEILQDVITQREEFVIFKQTGKGVHVDGWFLPPFIHIVVVKFNFGFLHTLQHAFAVMTIIRQIQYVAHSPVPECRGPKCFSCQN